MISKIKSICDATIENYRYSKQELRFDGDYVNHFSALINGYNLKEIPVEAIKNIRKYIKIKTSNMSPFRGDMLYILSFLIASNTEINMYEFIDDILDTFENLVNQGFDECENLILSAYSITKYIDKDERKLIIERMYELFFIIKNKYENVTKHDDYLLCSLLAIKHIKFYFVIEKMDFIFNNLNNFKLGSKNGIQSLTNAILLNENTHALEKVLDLLINLEKNDYKIGNQFLHIIGVLVNNQDVAQYINDIKEVIEYLCEEEYEYDFYIDKDFRNMIAIVIVLLANNKVDYIDELIAFGTYSFLHSKNQGMRNEVLI